MDTIATMWSNIASIGWYLLGIAFSLWYLRTYIRDKYLRWKEKREEMEYSRKYHKNPDIFQARMMALDASRQKLQREYTAKALSKQKADDQYKQKKKEVPRNLEKDLGVAGNRLGRGANDTNQDDQSGSSGSKSKSLKSEYNPLMGDGARGYRPPKRSCCRKGGCG